MRGTDEPKRRRRKRNRQTTKGDKLKTYVGIDNGTTGTVGIVTKDKADFFYMPTFKSQDYTKKKKIVTRIDGLALQDLLPNVESCLVVLERPMVNPTMFNATLSAVRAMEATLIVLEILQMPYMFVDSKEWQKDMLPQGTKGRAELKKASYDVGCRLFPQFKDRYDGDADGILIARWAQQKGL